jgi:diguanylate cyclase (GGDEF)-like protein
VPLEADPGADGPLGVLRLRFRVDAKLSEHEQYMLTTFAAGLSTAVRNANAYAEVARLADLNAHDATHDSLTDLPNRRLLRERMAAALDREPRGGTVALMLLDLDHFKEVNDTLGHGAGDRVLVEVADRLSDGAGEALVARLGGDEFAVLYTGLGAPALASVRARSLLDRLRKPMELDGVLISLQTSAGLAVAGHTTDPGELLRRADVAMYQAKDSGRQVAIYAQASDSADRNRLTLAGELPRAVEGQEFTVGFQPIVDLASGKVIAAEALTRWQHPDLGHLPPATFLGLIERSGLLEAFTEAVLHRALSAAADWRAAGFDIPVAVNISPRSLGDSNLPKMVLHALDTIGVDPRRLTLEVTETVAVKYIDIVGRSIATLQKAGVRISLDDFGTGLSSLAAVLHLPVNELKIDRSFVAALDACPRARALVKGTITTAQELDLMVVAEGVERADQRRTLSEMGCTAGQGSLFGWPAQPTDELIATLRRGHDGTPGMVAEQLNPDATVLRLPRQNRGETSLGQQV